MSLALLIGYQFGSPALLETALTHRSAGQRHNERLEFLGDAILSYVITDELYRRFPAASEGQLSRLRAGLVKGDTLAAIARDMALGDYLKLGSGELKSGGFRRSSILADAFEAVIGAIYLDGGIEAASEFIHRHFAQRLAECDPDSTLKDPKTRLQEFLQARGHALPEYRVDSVVGEPHKQTFTVTCVVEGMASVTVGVAGSRRKAEQEAARHALEQLNSST